MLDISVASDETALVLVPDRPCRVLASAVLNGGESTACSFLNLRVKKHAPPPWPEPSETLRQAARHRQLPLPCTGMMTAASMQSLAHSRQQLHGLQVECWVTAGLGNLRRYGDPPDDVPPRAGTINILLAVSQPLTGAALAEALMLLTECRVSVVLEAGLKSPVSGLPAGGTGTDSHAVFCPVAEQGESALGYCGKHTEAGWLIAGAVSQACRQSIGQCLRTDSVRAVSPGTMTNS